MAMTPFPFPQIQGDLYYYPPIPIHHHPLPPYAPYPFPYPNQPPPPSPSYHAAAYHHQHRFQLPPPSHPNPHWHQGPPPPDHQHPPPPPPYAYQHPPPPMQQMQPPPPAAAAPANSQRLHRISPVPQPLPGRPELLSPTSPSSRPPLWSSSSALKLLGPPTPPSASPWPPHHASSVSPWSSPATTAATKLSTRSSSLGITSTSDVALNVFGEMPQVYGLHNLNRHSMFLADGTEHSFYALPENYPLERATPSPVFDACADETDGCSTEIVHVLADLPEQHRHEQEQHESAQPTKCSKANNTANSESLLVPNLQLSRKVQDAPHMFKGTPVYDIYEEEDSACLNITSDVQDFTLELQQQDDERAYNCSDLKASDSVVTWSSQLSIEHSMSELSLQWDPGVHTILSFSTEHRYCRCASNLNTDNKWNSYTPLCANSESPVWSGHLCTTTELQHIRESPMKKGNIFSTGRILPWNPWYAILFFHHFLSEFLLDMVLGKIAMPNLVHSGLRIHWIQLVNCPAFQSCLHTTVRNQKKPDNELIVVFVNKALDNAFSEDVRDVTSTHVPYVIVQVSTKGSVRNNKTKLPSLPDSELCGKQRKPQQGNNKQRSLLLTEMGREVWDPGASLPLLSRKTQHYGQDLQPATQATTLAGSRDTRFTGYKCLPFRVQNNIYVFWESDNGVTAYFYWNQDIKFNGIAIWLITFNPP